MLLESLPLQGNLIRLEPLTVEHREALAAIAFEKDLWLWSTSRVQTLLNLEFYIEDALKARDAGTAIPYVTVENSSGQVVGCTRFGNANILHRRIEIGWTFVALPFQRTGVNTEAKYLMLRHAFEKLGCIRIEFPTDALNVKSRKAILRLGATEEGILRNHMIVHDGRIRNSVVFSITNAEWPAIATGLLAKLSRSEKPSS